MGTNKIPDLMIGFSGERTYVWKKSERTQKFSACCMYLWKKSWKRCYRPVSSDRKHSQLRIPHCRVVALGCTRTSLLARFILHMFLTTLPVLFSCTNSRVKSISMPWKKFVPQNTYLQSQRVHVITNPPDGKAFCALVFFPKKLYTAVPHVTFEHKCTLYIPLG